MNLEELRKERHHIAARISSWKKAGKDITDLLKQEADIVTQIKAIKAGVKPSKPEEVVKQITLNAVKKEAARVDRKAKKTVETMIPTGEQNQLKTQATKADTKAPRSSKSWKKNELEKCERTLNKILEDNDWHDGYQFRSSEWMYIRGIKTQVLPDAVALSFTMEYRTNSRKVVNNITRYYNPDTVMSLNKYIEQLELWVMLNSGDMDNNVIFGARFNKALFEEQDMAGKGWIIKK